MGTEARRRVKSAMSTFRDESFTWSRRQVLRAGLAGVAVTAFANRAFAAPKLRKIPISLQLWSLKDACAKDFDGTLAKVAEMGFQGVEFAGYHNYQDDAKGLRKRLDALKLKAAATHIKAASFAPDQIDKTIAFHKELGCRYLIVPGDGRFSDPAKSEEYAKLLGEASQKLKRAGMFCGHHNHTEEFKIASGDKTYWDLFAERTPKEVVLQQDVGWSSFAGLDPVALVKKYPGRTRVTHFKAKLPKGADPAKKPFIGEDTIDWKSLVVACSQVGGTDWITVEQEEYPDGLSPEACVKRSLDGLKGILSGLKA